MADVDYSSVQYDFSVTCDLGGQTVTQTTSVNVVRDELVAVVVPEGTKLSKNFDMVLDLQCSYDRDASGGYTDDEASNCLNSQTTWKTISGADYIYLCCQYDAQSLTCPPCKYDLGDQNGLAAQFGANDYTLYDCSLQPWKYNANSAAMLGADANTHAHQWLKKNLANKIFGYLTRCEGKFCTTTLKISKKITSKSTKMQAKCRQNLIIDL